MADEFPLPLKEGTVGEVVECLNPLEGTAGVVVEYLDPLKEAVKEASEVEDDLVVEEEKPIE